MSENTKVLSALPGIFYRKPSPDEDVYVNEGDEVKSGDTIGIIEVMKTFFEVKAETDGVLESFLIANEDMVDAGQELAVLIK
ncbi:acetyl-CoA carboxylase [Sporosarcina sp. G11-34]|uniref:acetyl-CoA carboxylase n=1 Tax=Sporosarcina sp. G11-34 TaxID=2849605 RepID=UPI0022A92FA1|nr:acetyl-CoA carboxylase [Sporosarcina sp. G11-34]MCZ2258193.1 biotin carboxyl carrier domain-containing protein [Sporosarcina sp. G11-34]